MSVYTKVSNQSGTPSILKKSIKQRYDDAQTPSKVRFQLPHTRQVGTILQDFVNNRNVSDYKDLIVLIRDSEMFDDDIYTLLKEVSECIFLLNLDLRLFVEAILVLKWAHRNDAVVSEYQSFIVNLLSAHNYHTKCAMDNIVASFMHSQHQPEWPNGEVTDADCRIFVNIHSLLNVILKVIPMSQNLLVQSLKTTFPYFKKSAHCHELYIHNILWILEYKPELRLELLQLVFNKLTIVDANLPREQIEYTEFDCDEHDGCETVFNMDVDDKSFRENKMKLPLAHTMDVCMDKIFNFFLIECHNLDTEQMNWEKMKTLYQDMIQVFDKIILPTYNSNHVQFAMFYLCSLKTTLAEAFINYLWKKVTNPNVASIHKQSAIGYLSSFLARMSNVTLIIIKGVMQQMSFWILTYISNQDGLECINSDVRVHTVFYSVCQALFYIIAFRHRDFIGTKKNMSFLQSLNLGKIVTSRLNPLRVCQPTILQTFAAVARTYQLAYCYSIIEHNARSTIPTVYQDDKGSVTISSTILNLLFPFDPYLLKRSANKIIPIYLEYNGAVEDHDETEEVVPTDQMINECDTDDFLMDTSKHNLDRFSYGTSPGFKHKSS